MAAALARMGEQRLPCELARRRVCQAFEERYIAMAAGGQMAMEAVAMAIAAGLASGCQES